MISDFKNKKVAVIGGGVEGISSAEFLIRHGADVTILDQKEKLENSNDLASQHIHFQGGKDYLANLSSYDVIVRSPGVKRNLPEITAAEEKGVLVTSHTQIFFDESPAPIIGVTGTKGKGTTSSLIYEMLKEEDLDVYLGGNIGVPPLSFLDKLKNTSWVVLELSSFQLEDLGKSPADAKAMAGKPHIAVMLMIVPEHLGKDSMGTQNYHESMEEYVDAKRNIVRWQGPDDYAVLNRDYPATHESDIHTEGHVYQVSTERSVDSGCFVQDGRIILRKISNIRNIGKVRRPEMSDVSDILNTRYSDTQSSTEYSDTEIIDSNEILLPGRHNLENVCAAVMAASLAGVSKKSMVTVLRTFKGLEHRLELVKEVRGVRYYDDSFSTTPETAIAAIEAFEDPEIVILGGASKNSDFTELGNLISTRVNIKAVIGIGTEWERIKDKLRIENGKLKIVEGCKNMHEIVETAAKLAEPGDVVLLSPACTSFDMFKNYKDRGEQFKQEVRNL